MQPLDIFKIDTEFLDLAKPVMPEKGIDLTRNPGAVIKREIIDEVPQFLAVRDPFADQRAKHEAGKASMEPVSPTGVVNATRKPRKPGTRKPSGRRAAGTRANKRLKTVGSCWTDASTVGMNPKMDNEKRYVTYVAPKIEFVKGGKHVHHEH